MPLGQVVGQLNASAYLPIGWLTKMAWVRPAGPHEPSPGALLALLRCLLAICMPH